MYKLVTTEKNANLYLVSPKDPTIESTIAIDTLSSEYLDSLRGLMDSFDFVLVWNDSRFADGFDKAYNPVVKRLFGTPNAIYSWMIHTRDEKHYAIVSLVNLDMFVHTDTY